MIGSERTVRPCQILRTEVDCCFGMGKKQHPRDAKMEEEVSPSAALEFYHQERNITTGAKRRVCEKEPSLNGQENNFRRKKKKRKEGKVVANGMVEDRTGGVTLAGISPTTPKFGKASEIDEIFNQGKAAIREKKLNCIETCKKQKAEEELKKVNPFRDVEENAARHKIKGKPAPPQWAWQDEVRPVRYDNEGLPIYSLDSLRINQGGGTDLCPFDCFCCF